MPPAPVRSLAASVRSLPSEVLALVAVAFSVAVGFGVVAPAIPVFARSFHVSRAAASAVISAFALTRLLFALTSGRLVDRLGERWVLATGIGIVAVSSALAGLAQNYVELVVLRGLGGVGSAMFIVSAMSLLLRSVASEQRAQASGLFQGGFLLGGIAGPALGGAVIQWSVRAPFFIYAGTLAVAGSVGLYALRNTALRDKATSTNTERITFRTALGQPAYRAALAANLADSWAVLGVRSALIPLFVTEALHLPRVWIGIGFAVVAGVNALVLLPAGRYADAHGRRSVLVAGCTASALGVALLAFVPSLGGYLVAMAVFGVGSGMLDVAPAAIVGDVAGGRGGTVVAAYTMSGDVGVIIGPLVAGRLADVASHGGHASYTLAFAVTACVLGVAALVGLTIPRQDPTVVAPAAEPVDGVEPAPGS